MRNEIEINANTLAVKNNTLNNLTKQYFNVARAKHLFLTREELKEKNIIDSRKISKFHPEAKRTDSPYEIAKPDLKFMQEVKWYALIPCFEEGVIRVNTLFYQHFKIVEIDTENEVVVIDINAYMRDDNFGWISGDRTRVWFQLKWHDEESPYIETDIKWKGFLSFISEGLITTNELGWTKEESHFWDKNVDRFNKNTTENDFSCFTEMFPLIIIKVNEMLYNQKPKAIRETKEEKAKRIATIGDISAPRKITRVLGDIKLTSEKPPKAATKETIVKYKVATWQARGGLRHLKSGKIVPFTGCVKHRKCLESLSDGSVPSILLKVGHISTK